MKMEHRVLATGGEVMVIKNKDGKVVKSLDHLGWVKDIVYREDGQEDHGTAREHGKIMSEWKYEYDDQDREISYTTTSHSDVVEDRGHTIEYSEDGLVKTFKSNIGYYGYVSTSDKYGREIRVVFMEGSDYKLSTGYEYEYNENGDVTKRYQYRQGERGDLVSEYVYNTQGNLTHQMSDGVILLEREYNKNGDLIWEEYKDDCPPATTFKMNYFYDFSGRKIKTVDSSGTTVLWNYTNFSVVESVYHDDILKYVTTTYDIAD